MLYFDDCVMAPSFMTSMAFCAERSDLQASVKEIRHSASHPLRKGNRLFDSTGILVSTHRSIQ